MSLALLGGVAAAVAHSDEATVARSGAKVPSGVSTTVTTQGAAPVDQGQAAASTAVPAAASDGGDGTTTLPPGDASTTVPASSAGPDGAADVAYPAAGTYTLTVTGDATINGSPQQVPDQAQLVIDHVSASAWRQRSPSGSGEFVTDLDTVADEVQLTRLQLTGGGVNKDFQPATPLRYLPRPLTPGQQWQWTVTSSDGKTTIAQTAGTTGSETLTIGGVGVATVVVHSVMTISGDLSGTVDLTAWVDPATKLAVRQHAVVDATYLTFRVHSDTTGELVSLTPS